MMLQGRYVSKCLITSIAFDAALLFVVIISHVILFASGSSGSFSASAPVSWEHAQQHLLVAFSDARVVLVVALRLLATLV